MSESLNLRRGNKTIVVVEDEFLVRIAIADCLRDEGYRVIEVDTADDAMELMKGSPDAVSAVFSDVQLPGTRDGIALAQWITQELPDIPVVLTSGSNGAERSLEACVHFIPKPYSYQTVIARLDRLLKIAEPNPSLSRNATIPGRDSVSALVSAARV